jgi:hypothetical protein
MLIEFSSLRRWLLGWVFETPSKLTHVCTWKVEDAKGATHPWYRVAAQHPYPSQFDPRLVGVLFKAEHQILVRIGAGWVICCYPGDGLEHLSDISSRARRKGVLNGVQVGTYLLDMAVLIAAALEPPAANVTQTSLPAYIIDWEHTGDSRDHAQQPQ